MIGKRSLTLGEQRESVTPGSRKSGSKERLSSLNSPIGNMQDRDDGLEGPEEGYTSSKHANKRKSCNGGDHHAGPWLIMEDLIKLPFFLNASRQFVSGLVSKTLVCEFDKEEFLMRQNVKDDNMVVISKGNARVIVDGQEVISNLTSGDFLGEINMLAGENRAHVDIQATVECTAYKISADVFHEVLLQFPEEQVLYDQYVSTHSKINAEVVLRSCCYVFHKVSAITLASVALSLVRRILFPGHEPVRQGSHDSQLFILFHGDVSVCIDGQTVTQIQAICEQAAPNSDLKRGSISCPATSESSSSSHDAAGCESSSINFPEGLGACFGELSMLGYESVRTATIRCESVCHVGILHRKVFVQILDAHHEALDAEGLHASLARRDYVKTKELPRKTLHDISIFTEVGCSDLFLDYLTDTLDRRLYMPGQKIVDENATQDDRSMYILSVGAASVMKDGRKLATLGDGDFFGEAVLLGLSAKRSTTIVADKLCHVDLLNQSTMIKGLQKFPGEKQKVLMIAFKKGAQNTQYRAGLQVEVIYEMIVPGVKEEEEEHIVPLGQKGVVKQIGEGGDALIEFQFPSAKVLTLWIKKSNFESLKEIRNAEAPPDAPKPGIIAKKAISSKLSVSQAKVGKRATIVQPQAEIPEGADDDEEPMVDRPRQRKKSVVSGNRKSVAPGEFEKQSKLRQSLSWSQQSFAVDDDFEGIDNVKVRDEGIKGFVEAQEKIVAQSLSTSRFFAKASDSFVKELSSGATDRIFMPGEKIVVEGSQGESMFIMITGRAVVYTQVAGEASDEGSARNTKKIGMLEAGSVSGELVMLGVSATRSATIEAETIVSMWEIGHDAAMPIIGRHPLMQTSFLENIVAHLDHTVPACIDGLPSFNGFDRKFRLLMGLYAERRAYFSGNIIFREGVNADGLYVLNIGTALMSHKMTRLAQYGPGSYFNMMCMLGLMKNSTCTLTAFKTCHLVVIARASFLQALEQYPARAQFQEFKVKEQASHEKFKQEVHRLCNQKVFMARLSHAIGGRFSKIAGGTADKSSSQQMLRKILTKWQKYASGVIQYRKKTKRDNIIFEGWVVRKKEAVALRNFADKACGGLLHPLSTATAHSRQPSISSPRRDSQKQHGKLFKCYLSDPRELGSIVMPTVPNTADLLTAIASTGQPSPWDTKRLLTPRTPGRVLPSLGFPRPPLAGELPARAVEDPLELWQAMNG